MKGAGATPMHAYYAKNKKKLRKQMDGYLRLIAPELEQAARVPYADLLDEIWNFYEANLLEYFPYIGGSQSSGTGNLTGSFILVAEGEVLKRYGLSIEDSQHLMVQMYRRYAQKIPGIVRPVIRLLLRHPRPVEKAFCLWDRQNAANAKKNPGSFETETKRPPDDGSVLSFYTFVCPIARLARALGYEAYVPYMCNMDYVLYGALGVPLYRTHTCFADGDYCDYNVRPDAEILEAWPPVFTQGKGYK